MLDGDGNESATGAWNATRVEEWILAGKWSTLAVTDSGDLKAVMNFEKTSSGFNGKLVANDGQEYNLTSVSADGSNVEIVLPYGPGTVKIKTSFSGSDKLTGKWHYSDDEGGDASGDWSAERE